jgi:FtsP/CotA-like multicopper oxidase with cupredoxin domain
MFKAILGVAVLSVATTLAFTIPEPQISPGKDTHNGPVMAVTADTIMVMDDRDNELETFAVTSQTKIMLNGQPAPLAEVQMGDRATITGRLTNGELVALTIDAISRL